MEKIYSVRFNKYTNVMQDCVSNGDEDISKIKYLHVGKDGFLIREKDIDKIRNYGCGINCLKFVGNLEEFD